MMIMKGVKNCKCCLHVVNLNEYTAELKEEKLIAYMHSSWALKDLEEIFQHLPNSLL